MYRPITLWVILDFFSEVNFSHFVDFILSKYFLGYKRMYKKQFNYQRIRRRLFKSRNGKADPRLGRKWQNLNKTKRGRVKKQVDGVDEEDQLNKKKK